MLYYLFNDLGIGGESLARLSSYITVRSSVAFVLSLLCATIIGRRIIARLQLMQMGEIVRNLTGKLQNFTRDGINDKIMSLGAKPGSSVTRKTDYLICGEKAGSKLAKSQELGITVLTEQQFLAMLPA